MQSPRLTFWMQILVASLLWPSIATAAESSSSQTIFLEGRVLAGGKALAGADVLLFAGDGPMFPAQLELPDRGLNRIWRRASTGRRGSYRLPVPRPGRWTVWVEARGWSSMRSEPRWVEKSVELPRVVLPASREVEVDVGLATAAKAAGEPAPIWLAWHAMASPDETWTAVPVLSSASFSGLSRVVVPHGIAGRIEAASTVAPALGLEIDARLADAISLQLKSVAAPVVAQLVDLGDQPLVGVWVLTATGTPIAVSDAQGGVSLPSWEAEPDRFLALTPDGLIQPLALVLAESGAVTARVMSRRISGRVVDSVSGQPISGAVLWPDQERAGLPAVTGSDGSFDLKSVANLPTTINVRGPRYEGARSMVERVQSEILKLQPRSVALGRIEDTAGEPIAGAQVVLSRKGSAAGALALRATTDEEGIFRISNPSAGVFDLEVAAEGYQSVSLQGAVRLSRMGPKVDLGVMSLAPGLRLEGWVFDPWGEPVAEAEVVVVKSLGEGAGTGADSRPPRFLSGRLQKVKTDDQGRFEINGLAPGLFDLRAEKQGFRAAQLSDLDPWQSSVVELTLGAAPAVRGRVVDGDGGGVTGALVTVSPARTSGQDQPAAADLNAVRSAQTGEQGEFELVGLPEGSFDLAVTAAGFRRAEWLNVKLDPAADDEGLELVLQQGALIFGTVLQADGSPAAAVDVEALRVDSGSSDSAGSAGSPGEAGFARADGQGGFEIQGLEPGTYRLVAQHSGGRQAEQQVSLAGDEAQVELWLDGGAVVTGRVLDRQGQGIVGAQVQLTPTSPSATTPTTVSEVGGTFTFEGVGAGSYRLLAESSDYLPSRSGQEIRVDQAPVSGLEAVLSRGITVVGRVVGASFEELEHVVVRSIAPGHVVGTSVDAEGRFELGNVRPGDVVLEAQVAGESRMARQRLTLSAEAAPSEVELVLSQAP